MCNFQHLSSLSPSNSVTGLKTAVCPCVPPSSGLGAREYCTEHFSILGFLLLLDLRSSYLLGAIINHFLTIMTGDRALNTLFYVVTSTIF